MVAATPLAPDDVESIDVETYSIAHSLTGHIAGAESELGAKFSTPIALGLYLVFGRSDAGVFTRANVADPRVRRIAERVTVQGRPGAGRGAAGQAQRAGDRAHPRGHLQKEVVYPKGEPEFPLTDAEMQAKFDANAGTLYPADHARRISETIMTIERRNVRELTALLTAPAAAG